MAKKSCKEQSLAHSSQRNRILDTTRLERENLSAKRPLKSVLAQEDKEEKETDNQFKALQSITLSHNHHKNSMYLHAFL